MTHRPFGATCQARDLHARRSPFEASGWHAAESLIVLGWVAGGQGEQLDHFVPSDCTLWIDLEGQRVPQGVPRSWFTKSRTEPTGTPGARERLPIRLVESRCCASAASTGVCGAPDGMGRTAHAA